MVRLSMVIQSNDRGSGLKTALPDRFTGLQKKIIWRLFFDDAPFIHEDNPVRHAFGKIQLMRHANHAHPLISKRDYCVQNFLDHFRIKR